MIFTPSTRFVASSSNLMRTEVAPVTADPLTIAAWFLRASSLGQTGIVWCGDSATAGDWFTLGTTGTGRASAWHRKDSASAGTGEAVGTTILGDAWYQLVAVFASSTSRLIYVNGTEEGANTQTVATDWTNNRLAFGYFADSTPSSYTNGSLAHVSIWDEALSAAEIERLWNGGIGTDPRDVRSNALRSYHPLNDSHWLRDIVGQSHMEVTSGTYFNQPSPQGYAIDVPRRWVNHMAAPADLEPFVSRRQNIMHGRHALLGGRNNSLIGR